MCIRDSYDNEIVPESVRVEEWNRKTIRDASGLTEGPFLLELTAGRHVLTFACGQGTILIGKLTLSAVSEPEETASGRPEGDGFTVIEAERLAFKNDATIRPSAEFNVDLTPYEAKCSRLNMLSGACLLYTSTPSGSDRRRHAAGGKAFEFDETHHLRYRV